MKCGLQNKIAHFGDSESESVVVRLDAAHTHIFLVPWPHFPIFFLWLAQCTSGMWYRCNDGIVAITKEPHGDSYSV